MSAPGDVCAAGVDPAARERRAAARQPRGGAFVVILRVAILALGPGSRGGCRPLARRAAPRARANVLVRDSRPMIRPVLTEVALFLAPFLVYAVFLWATQAGVLHPNSWSLPRFAWLLSAARVLSAGGFLVLVQWGGSPPGATSVPAHIEGGHFVPGETTCRKRGAASMPHGCERRRCATFWPRSRATARRPASSAGRCAMRSSARRTATSTSPPPCSRPK